MTKIVNNWKEAARYCFPTLVLRLATDLGHLPGQSVHKVKLAIASTVQLKFIIATVVKCQKETAPSRSFNMVAKPMIYFSK